MQHKKPVLLVPTELVHKRTFAQHADRALILAKRALSGNLCYDPLLSENKQSVLVTVNMSAPDGDEIQPRFQLSGAGVATVTTRIG